MNRINHLATILLGLMLITIPFMMGDYKDIARLEIIVIGMVMWVLLLWNGFSFLRSYKLLSVFVGLSLLFVGIYSVPLSTEIVEGLPGRDVYVQSGNFIGGELNTLSLIPQDSFLSFIYAFSMAAIFMVILRLPDAKIRQLLIVLGLVVGFEAGLGIIQYASGVNAFYIGMEEYGNTASGTYRNRDHYVALLVMFIPVIMAGILMSTHSNKGTGESSYWEGVLGQGIFLTILLIITVLAAVLSGSRAGIALAMLGFFISGFFLFIGRGKLKSLGVIVSIAVITVAVALNIGIVSILNRFADDPIEDMRWHIFDSTKLAIQEMLPLGAGAGTYPEIFRIYQPLEMSKFINHAHNDFYELLFDMGFLGLFIIIFFFVLYGIRWGKLLKENGSKGNVLQISIGVSLGLFLLHSYVDFNFYIPMNSLLFVVFFGIFCRCQKII